MLKLHYYNIIIRLTLFFYPLNIISRWLYTESTWTNVLLGVTTCTVLFVKISLHLHSQHLLGAEKYTCHLCYLHHFQMWHTLFFSQKNKLLKIIFWIIENWYKYKYLWEGLNKFKTMVFYQRVGSIWQKPNPYYNLGLYLNANFAFCILNSFTNSCSSSSRHTGHFKFFFPSATPNYVLSQFRKGQNNDHGRKLYYFSFYNQIIAKGHTQLETKTD